MTRHLAPLLAALAFGFALVGAAPPAQAQISIDIDFFHDRLSPYGRWVEHDDYGDVWIPARQRNWRPYSNGRWLYTDEYGWLWVERDEWGWATEHYGRWQWHPRWGWFWVPGTEWAPAWVSWRRAPDYIGWAPLPPHSHRHRHYRDYDYYDDYDDRRWVFVPGGSFLAPSLSRVVIVEPSRTRVLRERVPVIGDVRKAGRRWENRAIDTEYVERVTKRKVKRVRVRDAEQAQRTKVENDAVAVYRPEVRQRPDDARRGEKDRRNGKDQNVREQNAREQGSPQQKIDPKVDRREPAETTRRPEFDPRAEQQRKEKQAAQERQQKESQARQREQKELEARQRQAKETQARKQQAQEQQRLERQEQQRQQQRKPERAAPQRTKAEPAAAPRSVQQERSADRSRGEQTQARQRKSQRDPDAEAAAEADANAPGNPKGRGNGKGR